MDKLPVPAIGVSDCPETRPVSVGAFLESDVMLAETLDPAGG
jgi:hypothetical protein